MATFTPSKKNITDFNGGEEYQNGSGLQAETINSIIESQLYTQGLAKNAPNVTEANQEGTATVTIEQTADGTPRLKFANLKGAKGEKGEKGDKGDAGSIANLDEVVAPLLEDKADKYIFFDTENPVDIQSGMDLSGQTIAISSYYDMDGMLIQFENGKYIGAVMGTFGLFPSPSEYTAEVVFWERGSWDNEQYTFPTGQGWTVIGVDSFAYHYINIIEHKVVDCEYNYKKIASSLKPLFRYGFTAYITLGNGMPVECYGSALSSDPNLIYDENAATYSFVDAFNIGLLMSGMVLTNYTYNNSYMPMILTGSAGEFRLFWGTAMGQLMLYDYDINSSSSYIRVDTRTTVL